MIKQDQILHVFKRIAFVKGRNVLNNEGTVYLMKGLSLATCTFKNRRLADIVTAANHWQIQANSSPNMYIILPKYLISETN